jgi:hypothetical protein
MIAQFVSFGLVRVGVCVNLKAFNFLSWQVGPDSRLVMRKAYELFRDGGDTKEVVSEVLRRILSDVKTRH